MRKKIIFTKPHFDKHRLWKKVFNICNDKFYDEKK